MKILLLYPRFPDTFWSFKHALKFIAKKATHPPLGLLTVAAMLPDEWEQKLVDMNVGSLRDSDLAWADYVFLSAMAVQQDAVREILARCRQAGVKVVAGGPLFTAEHDRFEGIDHFVLNEAEITLPQFIADLQRGEARALYGTDSFPELSATPPPRLDLLNMKHYASMNIQYSRGCPFQCDFCDITTLFGHTMRAKQTAQIIAELENIYTQGWRGSVFFVDDNFIGNKGRLKRDLLPAMIAWMDAHKHPFVFITEASINLADDDDLMHLMVQAGFNAVFVGIETPEEESLAECAKIQNKNRDLVACVKTMQNAGLEVQGGFIVGFDHDVATTFQRQIDFIQKSGIVTAMVGLLNVPRGTRLYTRMAQEGRLIEEFSGNNTVFTTNFIPKMGYDALLEGYQRLLRGIYAPRPYYERVKTFLSTYKPLKHKTLHLFFGGIHGNSGYVGAFFRLIILLGIRDKHRLHFWKLFFWSLFTRPALFSDAMTYAIYGYHFRKVFEILL